MSIAKKKNEGVVLLQGTVIRIAINNDDGEIQAVGILTSDEKEYVVEDTKLGNELLSFVGKRAEAEGTVEEVFGEVSTIRILRYRLLDPGKKK